MEQRAKILNFPSPIEILRELIGGMSVRGMDVRLALNRPAPLRPLATATARGLSGHLLTATHPQMIRRWFKPGQDNNQLSACLFRPIHDTFRTASKFDFRIHTWDPPGELLPALADALERAAGQAFGESGATVRAVFRGPAEELRFSEIKPVLGGIVVKLITPARLKSDVHWISENELSLAHLVAASIRRLNLLSHSYGNGLNLPSHPWAQWASSPREIRRSLAWVRPRRRSSTQGTDLSQSGVVGEIQFDSIPHTVLELLSAAACFHIGQKTTEGCGCFKLAFAHSPDQSP